MIPPKKPFSQHSHPHLYPPEIIRTPEAAVQELAWRRAASAVCWILYDLCPTDLSLVERPRLPRKVDCRRVAEHYAIAELAGWEAARRHQPRESHWPESEMRVCELLLRHWSSSYPELCAYCKRIQLNARKLVNDPIFWTKVEVIAKELLMSVRVDREVLLEICRLVDESVRP